MANSLARPAREPDCDMSVVLITGCSSGFGRAAAEGFAALGHDVVATMRNPARALAPGGRAEGLDQVDGVVVEQLDVVDADSRERALATVYERFGHIDVLVNNAGISALGVTEEMPDDVVRNQWETNYFGPVALTKAVLPSMRERRQGRIVNISSIGGLLTPGFYGHYCATKHALHGITESLDIELQPWNIRCVTVVPGGYNTAMASNLIGEAQRADTEYPQALVALEAYHRRMNEAVPSDLTEVVDTIVAAATDDPPQNRYLVGGGNTQLLAPINEHAQAIHDRLRERDEPEPA